MKLGKYYDIRIKHEGHFFHDDIQTALGTDGQLPAQWGQIQQDPTVEHAEIYHISQRNRNASNRNVIDEYEREHSEDQING